MNKKLTTCVFIFFSLNAIAQTSENFDEISASTGTPGAARTINDWSFSITQVDGTMPSDSQIDITNAESSMAGAGDNIAHINGGASATAAVIKTVSGNSFQLRSFRIESGSLDPQQYRLAGYKDGVAVPTASFDFTAPDFSSPGGAIIEPTGVAWDNIDEFRITFQDDGSGVIFFMDDMVIGSALPVNFGAIEAVIIDNNLIVEWSTLYESNNDRFDIEASFDGRAFSTIGSVKSKSLIGNSDLPLSYEVSLPYPKGVFLGIGFAFLCIGIFRQRCSKIIGGMCIALMLLTVIACSKTDLGIKEKTTAAMYVRVAQIDKNGVVHYSKVEKVFVR